MSLVVAFDLDMTLIDTVPGVAGTLNALGGELGVDLPVAELTSRLGPPLDVLLDGHLPAEVMASAVDRFRELYVDHVTGLVVGVGKADALLREGASLLVGDHVHDVEGARAAGITSVSVLTGGCTEEELLEAGTDVVLPDLTAFPAWLDAYVAAQEPLGV
jgi:phosphoglycolate phosphatase-like HAD superfamily hydrolase